MSQPDSSAASDLVEALGADLVKFLLNADDSDVELYASTGSLPEPRTQACAALGTLASRFVEPSERPQQLRYFLPVLLGQQVAEASTSLANVLRAMAGGAIEEPETADLPLLEQCLGAILRDVYPLFLVKPQEGWDPFWGIPGPTLFNHAARAPFDEAVMADDVLARLFPGDVEGGGPQGYVLSSIGEGGSIQLATFAEMLLGQAWRETQVEDVPPSVGTIFEVARQMLRFIRAAVLGEKLELIAKVSLTGVTLPPRQQIRLSFGSLRPVRAADQAGLPIDPTAQLSASHGDETVTIRYSGDVVLETPIPYRIRVSADAPPIAQWPDDFDDRKVLGDRIEAVQLGLMLATEREPRPFVMSGWQVINHPLRLGWSVGIADRRNTPNLHPHALTPAECTSG